MTSAIRMLVTDLDGTLLDRQGRLTARTRQAVHDARAGGTLIALATSRRLVGTRAIAEELGGPLYLILYDGALVRTNPSERLLAQRTLPPDLGQRAADIISVNGLQPIAQHADADGERLLVAPPAGRGTWADDYLALNARQADYVPVEQLCESVPGPLRLVAFGPLRRIRAAARAVARQLPVGESIKSEAAVGTQILPLGSYGQAELTIFAAGVSKGAALSRLATELDIPLQQVMAIGDGVNDISMLRVAGTSVAMAGAPAAVRRAAHYSTASNADDGVAYAIEHFILAGAAQQGAAGA